MFGSEILDIAIGMVFVYLSLSLLCSGINEWIAHLLQSRARHLEQWVRAMLTSDPKKERGKDAASLLDRLRNIIKGLFSRGKASRQLGSREYRDFQDHPLIRALYQRDRQPSYIPSRTFMLALLDVVASIDSSKTIRDLKYVRDQVDGLQEKNPDLYKTMVALIDDAGNDIEKVRKNIEGWFDDSMERLSGYYKRRTQWVVLLLGIGISVAMNVNTFRVFDSLYRDGTVRDAVVAAAQRTVQQGEAAGTTQTRDFEDIQAKLQELKLPIGWSDSDNVPSLANPLGLLVAVLGWAISGFAAAQGAPFWFDTLNKLVNIRSTGERPATTASPRAEENPKVIVQTAAPAGNGPIARVLPQSRRP
jgi:hypothetical protein